MKRKIIVVLLLLATLFSLCSCTNKSTNISIPVIDTIFREDDFFVCFIDVGQGDAALVGCDGEYMLVDGGGSKEAGEKVKSVLDEYGVDKLKILAISHFHTDHVRGLATALTALNGENTIEMTISNTDEYDSDTYEKFTDEFRLHCSAITVPTVGTEPLPLGNAKVHILDVGTKIDDGDNASLVFMVEYKDTRILFTGDIGEKAQKRISETYNYSYTEKIDIIKMPHHGAYTYSLNGFLRTFMPDPDEKNAAIYTIISCDGKSYGHPSSDTLNMLSNPKNSPLPEILRTDECGNIIFEYRNGELIYID